MELSKSNAFTFWPEGSNRSSGILRGISFARSRAAIAWSSRGFGRFDGGDKALLVDLYGAVRAIDESAARGVGHFVMVSALRAERSLEATSSMRHYRVATLLADRHLFESGVPGTVLRPGRLTDEAGSGRVRTRVGDGEGVDISRENVADCVLEALREPPAGTCVVDLLDGDRPISSVFAEG